MYNLDTHGPTKGMAAKVMERPSGYTILSSHAPRFARNLKEAVDVAYNPETTLVYGSSSIAQAVETSPRGFGGMHSRVARFDRATDEAAGGGPGHYGVPEPTTRPHTRTALMGTTPRFSPRAGTGVAAQGGARDVYDLDLDGKGPTAGLSHALERSPRQYSVMRSAQPRFREDRRLVEAREQDAARAERERRAEARGRRGGTRRWPRVGGGGLAGSRRPLSAAAGRDAAPSWVARDAESLTAREARLGARSYGSVFRSTAPRFAPQRGDKYLRRRLAAIESGSGGSGEMDSLAENVRRSPRAVASLTSTSARFPGGPRVDTSSGPASAAAAATLVAAQRRGKPAASARDAPGPGAYDTERGLDVVERRRVFTLPLSHTPRFGAAKDGRSGQPGADTRALSSRWNPVAEAKQWTSKHLFLPQGGREMPVMTSRGVEGKSCAPDVVYPYDQAPSKRGMADTIAAGASPRGGAGAVIMMRSKEPRFADPVAVQAGIPLLRPTHVARDAGQGASEFVTPRIDPAGRTISIADRVGEAVAAGQSPGLRSRARRFAAQARGQGADVMYNISYYRSVEEEGAQSYRGGSAINRQGREQPVFRRDAGAIGWGTAAGAAGSDPMVGGLSKLHRQRQRAGASRPPGRPPAHH